MLPMAHLTLHSRMSGLGECSYHRGYLGHEDLFCTVLLCVLATFSFFLNADKQPVPKNAFQAGFTILLQIGCVLP